MKLRFSIHYRTEWGQQMMVSICYRSADGTERHTTLPMTTQNGDQWTGETAVVESRRWGITTFTYYYIVADGDGHELRREWTMMERTYAFDESKTFIFADQWRDMPLNSHLYTSAYEVTVRRGMDKTDKGADNAMPARISDPRLPLFRKTVLFRVAAPQLTEGQLVGIVGSHPALGSWNPTRYLPMTHVGHHDWMLTLNVDWIGMPIDYKYVVVDAQTHELLQWEEGDNRVVTEELNEGEVLVMMGEPLRVAEHPWRLAGVCIPVFALRSEYSYGVGDFGDLKRMVDWAEQTGLRLIQVLPVNDTTQTRQWGDSIPYNIISAFALHPHYIDLEELGALKDKRRMTAYKKRRQEMNTLSYSDYETVERVKTAYLHEFFEEQGGATLSSSEFREWCAANACWLDSYAKTDEQRFVQYHLHRQLKAAADYARSKGIVLKGDLPIGIERNSVEVSEHPDFFHLDAQTGAPPDALSMKGQNWGFPTYNWEQREVPGKLTLMEWFRNRLNHMAQYFDVFRIDHVLGYFRIWEIPDEQLFGNMGHFAPAMPMTAGEIEYYGLTFRKELLTMPFVNDRIVDRLFGIHAQYVRETFLERRPYGLYSLKPEVSTQRKVWQLFEGKGDENSMWIRDGLCRLVANVLFLEDPRQEGMYHPRIAAYKEPVFEALNSEERDAYMRLYNHFFYQRHAMMWGQTGYNRLSEMLRGTRMLACAEDLGMLPDCVAPVLGALNVLTLEIQQMPKENGIEFTHLDGNPIRSVATISTHDMAPMRLWWEENPDKAQRFFSTMLQKQGRAPQHLPAHLAEEIIARHLYSPSMLCVLSLQDWLAMDSELWNKNPREERINVPDDSFNRWQYRMHLKIDELLVADKFNQKIKTMVTRSKRA